MKELIELALEQGFTYAAALNPAALEVREEVRDMCAAFPRICRARQTGREFLSALDPHGQTSDRYFISLPYRGS